MGPTEATGGVEWLMREGGKQQAANPSRLSAFNEAQQRGLKGCSSQVISALRTRGLLGLDLCVGGSTGISRATPGLGEAQTCSVCVGVTGTQQGKERS